jgi:hypothetical protein
MSLNLRTTLTRIVTEQGGFLLPKDVAELAQYDRLRQVLVRCGRGRFTCAAQDAAHFIGIIDRERQNSSGCEGSDYVRDVSLLASDCAHERDFRPVTPTPIAARVVPTPKQIDERLKALPRGTFRKTDCGGAYDGFCVTSDADPGL